MRGYAWTCLVAASLCGRANAQPQVPAPAPAPAEETDAEVFARVFKKTVAPAHVPATLTVDGTERGTITLESRGTSFMVSTSEILVAVAPSLRPEARKELVRVAGGNSTCVGRPRFDAHRGQRHADSVRRILGKALAKDLPFLAKCDALVTIDALRAGGIDVTYDYSRLELRVTIPVEAQDATSHDLHGAPPSAIDARSPSSASGYLNFRATGGHEMSTGGAPAARQPLNLDVDAVLNAQGWLFEGRFDIGADLHRGDVHLLHDDPSRALRYIVGDYAVPMGGVQPGYPMAGISISRNYALQPYRNVQPAGKFDFILDRPARVTVLVNNAPVQTLSLPAGRHDIRDLRLDAGVNDVELVVQDQAGVERRLLFSTASGEELLAPGVSQFSLNAGFPLIDDGGMRTYDFSRPVVAARRRWGITSALTAGASFDGTIDRQVAGAALAMATTRGNLSIDLAGSSASRLAPGAVGHAERLRYRYQHYVPGHTSSQYTALLGHYSSEFRPLDMVPAGTTDPARYSDELALSMLRGLPRGVIGTLNLRYQIGRDGTDAHDLTVTAARAFGPLNVSSSWSVRDTGMGAVDKRWFVTAHWVLPEGRGSVRSTATKSTTSGLTNELVYTKRSSIPPGGLATSLALRETADAAAATASADYTGYRFTTAVSTTSSMDHSTGSVSQATSAEIGTALVFAGGRAAWSRPISGSFVIVAANDTIRGNRIGVNSALGGYASEDNYSGPAVVSNLDPYRVGLVRVEAPTLPLGYSLGPSSYTVFPTYKSGTLIVVGERGSVFVRGTLKHADGTPVSLATGEIRSLDASAQLPFSMMTNRAGRLSTLGLAPGRYSIRVAGDSIGAEFVIPANAHGLVDLGTLTLK